MNRRIETRLAAQRVIDDGDMLLFRALPAPDRPRPKVDFSRDMVVGVFLGTKPTAAYSVAVVSTIDASGVLIVRYRVSKPPAGAITAQVITFPYHLAAVPKSAVKDVKFETITEKP